MAAEQNDHPLKQAVTKKAANILVRGAGWRSGYPMGRSAIQDVHDQSLRGINQGMTPDELAENVILPAHLAKSPYLQEFYGKVSWSARSMHSGTMGWFSGDSANLQPLPVKEQAQMIADISGGEAFTIHVRRGVAEIIPRLSDNLDMLVRANSLKWKEMLGKLRSPVTTLASFDYPKGNAVAFALFLKLFEAPPIRLPFENKDK